MAMVRKSTRETATRRFKRARPALDEVDAALEEAVREPTRRSKKSKIDDVEFDYSSMFSASIDEISRRQGVDMDMMEIVKPMSTGSLMYDMLLGGGIRPAMYTHSGFEQNGKTTGALSIMAAAVKQAIHLIALFDFEGSTANSLDYVANILRTMGVKGTTKELFGKKDLQTGKWVIQPRVRYIAETRGEAYFDWLSAILRAMPDKKFVAGKWWLVFDENNKAHKLKVGNHADATMRTKYGKGLWVPAPDGNLQALILADSYPAMNPDSNDDEEVDRSLGVHARFFSKHLPRIKGRLARKMVAIIGINQLRQVPMAMYGPKEKEACGEALKSYSDCRTWWNSRSSGMPFNAKLDTEERVEIEPSVTHEGKDRYRYIQVVTKKNKLSAPGRKIWFRLWIQDAAGDARGFDPFFDTVHYLKETGQLSGRNRKVINLDLEGLGEAKRSCSWMTLKSWVLGDREQMKEISTKLGYAPMNLRAFCFKQIRDGIGEKLYIEVRNQKKIKETEEV